jgi:hypothetical protein
MKAIDRPWKMTSDGILTATGECIAEIPYYEEDDVQARANAALIVRAVNSHDALVRGCRIALAYLYANTSSSQYGGERAEAVKAINDALTLAGGE